MAQPSFLVTQYSNYINEKQVMSSQTLDSETEA